MTIKPRILLLCLLFTYLNALPRAGADTLIFPKGDPLNGTVLQTNREEILFLTDFGTMRFALGSLKAIRFDQVEAAEVKSTNRIPTFRTLLTILSRQPWATNLEQIPATVSDEQAVQECRQHYRSSAPDTLEE